MTAFRRMTVDEIKLRRASMLVTNDSVRTKIGPDRHAAAARLIERLCAMWERTLKGGGFSVASADAALRDLRTTWGVEV